MVVTDDANAGQSSAGIEKQKIVDKTFTHTSTYTYIHTHKYIYSYIYCVDTSRTSLFVFGVQIVL